MWTPRQLIAIGTAHKPVFRPGARWSYSNTGYIALGLTVEAVTGHALGTELRTRIFETLRLHATSFDTQPQIAGHYAHGYSRFGKKQLYDISFVDPSLFWGPGPSCRPRMISPASTSLCSAAASSAPTYSRR